jgi:hypothetical protein
MKREQKITLGEMRATGLRRLLVYCGDYKCAHHVEISAERWSDDVRLSDLEPLTPAMAAGVTKMLWEVSDIVETLEQWELANFKPEYQFVVRQYAIGKGHSVSVLWRGGEVDTIFGFDKADALQWIKEKSQAWLLDHR